MLRLISLVASRRVVARSYNQAELSRLGPPVETIRSQARLEHHIRRFLKSPLQPGVVPPQAYELLTACGGGLALESPETRVEVAHKLWQQFKQKGLSPDVSLYNTLMWVYTQNYHQFSQSHFLKDMNSNGVAPNNGTLALLLQAYCLQGNMAGAIQVLQQIKSLELPINENVYTTLITGHARSGDMDSAEKLLTVMAENGLTPGTISYTALVCAYAERGDMEGVEKILGQMKEQRLFPTFVTYKEVINSLSKYGHSQLIPQVLKMVKDKQWMRGDIVNLVLRFVGRGEFESAMILVHCLADSGGNFFYGHVMIWRMFFQGRDSEEIVGVARELQELGFGSRCFEELIFGLYKREAFTDVLPILKEMQSHGMEVRSIYFYPLLADCGNRKDLPGAMAGLQLMRELGLKVTNHVLSFCLKAAGEERMEALLKSLKDEGLESYMAKPTALFLCAKGDFHHVPELITGMSEDETMMGPLLRAVKSGVQSGKPNIDDLVQVYVSLHALQSKPDLSKSILITTSILIESGQPHLTMAFLDRLSQHPIPPVTKAYQRLLVTFSEPNHAKKFYQVYHRMQELGLTREAMHVRQVLKISSRLGKGKEAQAAFEELQSKFSDLNEGIYNDWIIAASKDKRLSLAQTSYQEMREKGKKPSYDALLSLISALLSAGNMTAALEIKEDMRTYGYTPGVLLYTMTINAHARRGEVAAAEKEFKAFLEAGKKPSALMYTHLMGSYAFHGAADQVRRLMSEMEEHGVTLSRAMVSQLFRAHINSDSLAEAESVLLEFPECLPHPPHMTNLLMALMQREEWEGVERVTKMMVEQLHLRQGMMDNILFFSLVGAGQWDRAREVIKREGFVVILPMLEKFVKANRQKLETVKQTLVLMKEHGAISEEMATVCHRYMPDT